MSHRDDTYFWIGVSITASFVSAVISVITIAIVLGVIR